MNHDHLLLARHDGARRAEALDAHVAAEVLHAIVDSLAKSADHAHDGRRWRIEDIRAIYNLGSGDA